MNAIDDTALFCKTMGSEEDQSETIKHIAVYYGYSANEYGDLSSDCGKISIDLENNTVFLRNSADEYHGYIFKFKSPMRLKEILKTLEPEKL